MTSDDFEEGEIAGKAKTHGHPVSDGSHHPMENDDRTEAACLLEQGATYHRRVGLDRSSPAEGPVFAGFKHGAFSLYFGDAPIYHFDLEGRWQRAFAGGIHFLKGLDADVHAIERVREGQNLVLRRRTLSAIEVSALDEEIRCAAATLVADLDGGRLARLEPPANRAEPLSHSELRGFLERIAAWNASAWHVHQERHRRTYGRPLFVPPECQNAVIVAATLGNAAGLTFGLGPAALPITKRPEEFNDHAREVAELWGKRLVQSKMIFLAGSDLMHLPLAALGAYFEIVNQHFPICPAATRTRDARALLDEDAARFDGVHVFIDNFVAPLPDPFGWRELASRGLARASLGVESGDPDLRRAYRKTWRDEDLRATVAAVKSAGLGISVLTLVGAGGVLAATAHIGETARLIESFELGPGDFVFLLDEKEIRDPDGSRSGITLMQGGEWLLHQSRLKEALAPLKTRGIKVLPYTFEKQWA
jgi:hypothetical protein